MRAVIQRVTHASVTIDGTVKGKIGNGFLVLFGAGEGDTRSQAELLARKTAGMRIFCDAEGKMNLSLSDVGGSVLVISQFTLYADANELYEYYVKLLREEHHIADVQTGVFGADMKVELLNDGPVTIILDSAELERARSEVVGRR